SVEVVDIALFSALELASVNDILKQFLAKNNLHFSEIDALVVGRNGDAFDVYYDAIAENFETITELHYKHLCGEFHTASSFGLWISYEILMRKEIPEALIFKGNIPSQINTILLYNQFKGR